MRNEMTHNIDSIGFNNNMDDLDYIIGRMEYKWKLDKDTEYLMKNDGYKLRKKSRPSQIVPEKPKTKFDCKTINNPYQLIKMGYTPSNKCWMNYHLSNDSQVPVNDYDIEEYKMVA